MRHGRAFSTIAVGVAIICLLGLVPSAQAATVTSPNDSGPGSLRAVIAAAGSGDTIDFHPSLDGETIELTSGEIAIDKSLTIAGPGASQLTIDAGHSSRIFTATAGPLSISGLTLLNGAAPGDGGAIYYSAAGALIVSGCAFVGNTAGGAGGADSNSGRGEGGAIYVSQQAPSPSLSVSESTFTANTAGGDGGDGFLSGRGEGGAIADYGGGALTISGSAFVANAVGGAKGAGPGSGRGSGGAIDALGGGSLAIADSTFTANTVSAQAGGGGGAVSLWNRSLTVSGSTFAANTVGQAGGGGSGGAIDAGALSSLNASVSIVNSTLVGNAAGGGGASGRGGALEVADMASATLAGVTIGGNSVGAGGGGAGINSAAGISPADAPVTARATIISGNTGAPNCDAPATLSRYSLEGPTSGDTSCGFDLTSADPQLEPLDDNGGPTETQALPATGLSPAADVVPAAHCPTSVDQRGEPRPDYGKPFCDVGAYELQGPLVAPQITSEETASFQVGKSAGFTVTATGVPAPSLSATGALPDGIVFTDNGDGTAALAGTPAAGTEGSHPIEIEAANGTSPDAVQGFTLMVAAPDPPIDPTEPPACPASPSASVAPCPDDPQEPSPRPLALSLAVERKSLGKLLRSGKLVVVARVNRAARLALGGRAKLRIGRSAQPQFTPVFKRKTVGVSAPGKMRVTLMLARKGRAALRHLRRVRLAIAGTATDAAGQTANRSVALTLRR